MSQCAGMGHLVPSPEKRKGVSLVLDQQLLVQERNANYPYNGSE
jgi:hypothetical protein